MLCDLDEHRALARNNCLLVYRRVYKVSQKLCPVFHCKILLCNNLCRKIFLSWYTSRSIFFHSFWIKFLLHSCHKSAKVKAVLQRKRHFVLSTYTFGISPPYIKSYRVEIASSYLSVNELMFEPFSKLVYPPRTRIFVTNWPSLELKSCDMGSKSRIYHLELLPWRFESLEMLKLVSKLDWCTSFPLCPLELVFLRFI